MKASFKTRLSSKEKFALTAMLISLATPHLAAPRVANAQTTGTEKAAVFVIKSKIQNSNIVLADAPLVNDNSQNQDKNLASIKMAKTQKKAELVKKYLKAKNSPFANYTEILIAQDDWKTILAVSNSESNMGLHCYKNNCSGIFGGRGLRTYAGVTDWMTDFQSLIDKRYKGWTLAKMNGVYVQPRSNNWLSASTKVYNDMVQIEQHIDNEDPNSSEA